MRALVISLPLFLIIAFVPSLSAQPFVRGDGNENGSLGLNDAVIHLNTLFLGAPAPSCEDISDINDDGLYNVADPIYLLVFLFTLTSPPPPPPYPLPGFDPTTDDPWPCGDAPPAAAERWLLIADMSGLLQVSELDETNGSVGAPDSFALPNASRPVSVEATPDGNHVYVADLDNGIHMLSFDPDSGLVTALPGSPLAAGGFASRIVKVDASGSFLYLGRSFEIRGYQIDPDTGGLTEIAGSPWTAGSLITGLEIDPSNTYVYASFRTSDDIHGFTIDASTGALSPIPGSPWPDPNPMGEVMQIATTDNHLYTMNAPQDPGPASVTGWEILGDGSLIALPTGPWITGADAAWQSAVSPCATNGAFVVVGHSATEFVSVFERDAASGELSLAGSSPVDTGGWVHAVEISEVSRVYADGWNSATVNGWVLDSTTGELDPTPLSPYNLGTSLRGMTIID